MPLGVEEEDEFSSLIREGDIWTYEVIEEKLLSASAAKHTHDGFMVRYGLNSMRYGKVNIK